MLCVCERPRLHAFYNVQRSPRGHQRCLLCAVVCSSVCTLAALSKTRATLALGASCSTLRRPLAGLANAPCSGERGPGREESSCLACGIINGKGSFPERGCLRYACVARPAIGKFVVVRGYTSWGAGGSASVRCFQAGRTVQSLESFPHRVLAAS